MSPPILATIDESTPLIEAAKMMREKGVGDLLIARMSDRAARPVGLITDRDIVVHAIACDLKLDQLTVGDLCTRDPVTVDADLAQITAAMSKHGVRPVLVTRDSEIAGIVTLDDVIDAMAQIMNNLSDMLTRQLDYETAHMVTQDNAA